MVALLLPQPHVSQAIVGLAGSSLLTPYSLVIPMREQSDQRRNLQ